MAWQLLGTVPHEGTCDIVNKCQPGRGRVGMNGFSPGGPRRCASSQVLISVKCIIVVCSMRVLLIKGQREKGVEKRDVGLLTLKRGSIERSPVIGNNNGVLQSTSFKTLSSSLRSMEG